MSYSREEIEQELARLEKPSVLGAQSHGSDDTRTIRSLGVLTKATLRLDQSIEKLDRSSSHLARINIWLTVVIISLTAATLAAAIIPLFRK